MTDTDNLLFRTVRMRASDSARFETAFDWLVGHVGKVDGCAGIRCYRAADTSDDFLIVEYWVSSDAMAAAYERLGDVPYQFMERAGAPDLIEDRMWASAGRAALGGS